MWLVFCYLRVQLTAHALQNCSAIACNRIICAVVDEHLHVFTWMYVCVCVCCSSACCSICPCMGIRFAVDMRWRIECHPVFSFGRFLRVYYASRWRKRERRWSHCRQFPLTPRTTFCYAIFRISARFFHCNSVFAASYCSELFSLTGSTLTCGMCTHFPFLFLFAIPIRFGSCWNGDGHNTIISRAHMHNRECVCVCGSARVPMIHVIAVQQQGRQRGWTYTLTIDNGTVSLDGFTPPIFRANRIQSTSVKF